MVKDIQRLTTKGRRGFLKQLATFGISIPTLKYISQNTLAEITRDIKKNVPYVSYLANDNPDAERSESDGTGRAPIYDTIPYDEWLIREAAHDAASRLSKRLRSKFGKCVGAGVQKTISGHQEKIVVTANFNRIKSINNYIHQPSIDSEKFAGEVDNTIKGSVGRKKEETEVEFDIKIQRNTIEKHVEDYFDSDYRLSLGSVPAGSQAKTSAIITTATPGKSATDMDVMITTGHGLEASSDNILYQPSNGIELGTIEEYENGTYFDAGYASVPADELCYDLAKDNGKKMGWPIDGIVTWDWLKYNVGNSEYGICMQGTTSGRRVGIIDEILTGSEPHEKSFVATTGSNPGDSGGPHYRVITDSNGQKYAYICGVNIGGTGWATSMEQVENHLGVFVS